MSIPTLPEPNISASAVIAPRANVFGDVSIGDHVFILFGVTIRAEFDHIEIGAETNIQDNTVVHCDEGVPTHIGERVTVGHAAVIHGSTVGDRALIGIGATTLNRSVVGEGAWLAAGSVLTEGSEIPPWTLAVGTPARPLRELTESEIERADNGVKHYLDLGDVYREIFQNHL